MEAPSNLNIIETSAEVKSFIYQQIQEFEQFVTPQSLISVISKKINDEDEKIYHENKEINSNTNPLLFKISISIKEDQTTIEEEGLSTNIYEAILIAKNKLLKKLVNIHDEVVTADDRKAQLESIKNQKKH